MRGLPYELIAALTAVAGVALWYLSMSRDGVPRPGSFVGHGLGIVGFLFMIGAETLYTLRKRITRFHLGRMTLWLQAHVFLAIVGSSLVLLHSAGKFNGLAGVLTLLTILIVLSGFVGRFIYTAVPRSLDGTETSIRELDARLTETDRRLQAIGIHLPASTLTFPLPRSALVMILGKRLIRRRRLRRVRRDLGGMQALNEAQKKILEDLLMERFRLEMQVRTLAAARRMLGLWYFLHVPLGVVVISLGFVHAGAALYYGTFSR